MKSSLVIFVAAFGVSAILTPLVRWFALRIGAFDEPDARRVHQRRIPRLGGIAVVAAFFTSLLVLFGLEQSSLGRLLLSKPVLVGGLFVGGVGAALLGAVDDLRGVRALHKLLVQVVIATIAYGCGFQIDAVALPWVGTVHFGLLGLPLTILWFVAVMNAVNLIDGLDGLAGGIAFVACVSNFVVGWMNDALLVVVLSAALAGAVLGFLIYNFNPASIFMGDTGSLFLGFVLAASSLLGSSIKSSTTVALLVPVLALGVPIMDTLFTMVRRWLERRPLFAPDRGHIHHKLLDLGLTHRRAVLTLYGVSVVLAASAVAVAAGQKWEVGGALVVVAIVVVGFVRAARIFAGVKLRRDPAPARSEFVENLIERLLRTIEDLGTAASDDEALLVVERFVKGARLTHARIQLPNDAWEVGAPNGQRGRVRLTLVAKRNPGVSGSFEFVDEWASSRVYAEVLLQLVVDAIARRHPAVEVGRERRSSGEAAVVAS
jgi:UDP-GlcNAc:undecaprenyl-phosphate GlcNAc-1-phosphate transferase